jgi:hypothetical protein
MTTLMQASNQWATRPADQRFVSLLDLQAKVRADRNNSVASVISTRKINVIPHPANPQKGVTIEGSQGLYDPTHFSFGQLAALAGAPAGYLRTLPAPLVADAMNYGLRFNRDAEEVGVLRTKTTLDTGDDIQGPVEHVELRAATGPRYGRIWNSDIVDSMVGRFGDGLTGDFRVPGEFGKAIKVTKDNTTLYASDRDMFVFLADEVNRVEMHNRRDGQNGSLARGFFIWNSEVGDATMGIGMFLFDYACSNRIIWGVEQFKEVRLRHTASAPDRFIEEVAPILTAYSQASALPIEQTIAAAQQAKLDTDLDTFLKNRKFTMSESTAIKAAHMREEGRPIETIWDATTAVTAAAKTIRNQNDRVAMERKGGALLDLAGDF